MNLTRLKHISAGIVLFISSVATGYGQDLIASQAPIDRKLKAVDSVALQRIIEAEEVENFSFLYDDSWDNKSVHCYSSAVVPDSFKIDLRGFAMPTPSRNVTSNYGYRRAFRRQHKGIDVKVYTGDTIYAAFDAKVRVVKYEARGYGKYIVLRHSNGLETIYGHLSKQLVSVDQEVKAGEPIGLGGNTGRSTGSHLHFETRLLGQDINPAELFDFANQDVTGDFYVFYKKGTRSKASSGSSRGSSLASAKGGKGYFYQVKKGDSLARIAKKLGVSVDKLCRANNLTRKSTLRPKQILKY